MKNYFVMDSLDQTETILEESKVINFAKYYANKTNVADINTIDEAISLLKEEGIIVTESNDKPTSLEEIFAEMGEHKTFFNGLM